MSGTLIPQVQPQNPFTQLGQTVQGINALQDFQAKRATADAYGQSIDPTTGAFDQGKFNALMASTPQGRWNIGPSMQQSGAAQSAEGQGTQQQIAAKQAQLNGIAGYMTPLVGQVLKGQPVTGQQVLDATNQAATAGFATPEMVSNIQKQVAQLGPNGDASNLVRGAYFATQTGQQQLATLAPPALPLNVGPAVVPWQGSQWGSGGPGVTPGSVAPLGMSPAQYYTPTDIQIGGGQTITMPFGVAGPMLENNPLLKKLNPNFGSQPGAVTNQSFGPNQGRYTPPASSTPPASGSGTPGTPPASTGPYVIGDSIGVGIQNAGKFDGNATVGASPQAVLATINDPKNAGAVKGRDVVLANGSNPGNLTMVQDQIRALQQQGANSITVVGVANPQIDKQLQQYAQDAGVRYVPMGAAGPDGIHPTGQGYTSLAGSVAPPAQPAQPAQPAAPRWAQSPPPVVQGGSAGGFGLTPAPGYVDSQQKTAAASTQAYNTLQAQITASKDIEPILADMDTQTRTAGFSTGIGSTVAGTVRQLAIRAGVIPDTPGEGLNLSSPQAAQEEFAKDAARLQAAQLGAMGNPTDARQELSETTNPGMMLSKYGNQGIIHMLQGNQQAIRMIGAAWAQAQQAGWTPDRYNEWMNDHFMAPDQNGGRFDPRAFWLANAPTVAEQKAYIAKVPPAQRSQLQANVQFAYDNGWLKGGPDGRVVVASQ